MQNVEIYKDGNFVSNAILTKPRADIYCFEFENIIASNILGLNDYFEAHYENNTYAGFIATNLLLDNDKIRNDSLRSIIPNQ